MKYFDHITDLIVRWSGSFYAVIGSVALVVVWAALGPYYGWSEGHQLLINTTTTIITFWMVFVIQHSQNKDTAALHAKIDALIRSIEEVPNQFIGIERETEEEIEELRMETLHGSDASGGAGVAGADDARRQDRDRQRGAGRQRGRTKP